MLLTDNLADQGDEPLSQAEWDARRGAITIDLYPALTRVITQRIRAIPAANYEALARSSYSWKPTLGEFRQRPAIGVGSVLRERYVIESCLGSGGMGTVYKAVDIFRRAHGGIDSHVAIKVLHESTRSPEVLDRLRSEFYCAQALSHKSVIKVYELDRDGGVDFFTMEWLDGELLSGVMRAFNPRALPRAAAWALIRDIGAGLVHAHERNVIHADLKPQNIMITKRGEVRILDFGASSGSLTASLGFHRDKSLAVTPAYASCELLAGETAQPTDDLFALACLSYELLTGEHPFKFKRADEACAAGMVPARPLNLSARQWRILSQGLSFDRMDRNIAVDDWLAELNPPRTVLRSLPDPTAPDACTAVGIEDFARLALMARRAGTLIATALIGLGVWLVIHVGTTRAPAAQAEELQLIPDEREAEVAAAAPPPALPAPEVQSSPTTPPQPPRRATHHRPAPAVKDLSVARNVYRLPRGARFAEIRVQRAAPSDEPARFVWWTEDASALGGFDYQTQGRTTAYFAPGSLSATVFIRVLDNAGRQGRAAFNVIVAEPGNGGAAARATVQLPATPR
jgi:hypothetical protein